MHIKPVLLFHLENNADDRLLQRQSVCLLAAASKSPFFDEYTLQHLRFSVFAIYYEGHNVNTPVELMLEYLSLLDVDNDYNMF